MKESLLTNYFAESDVNGNNIHWRERLFMADRVSYRFGPMRLRQLRVQSGERLSLGHKLKIDYFLVECSYYLFLSMTSFFDQ